MELKGGKKIFTFKEAFAVRKISSRSHGNERLQLPDKENGYPQQKSAPAAESDSGSDSEVTNPFSDHDASDKDEDWLPPVKKKKSALAAEPDSSTDSEETNLSNDHDFQKEQSVVIECKSRGEQCMDKVPNSQKEQSVVIECKSRGEQCMDKVPNSQKEQSVVIECKSRGEQCMDKVPNSQKEQSVVIECKSRGEQCMDKVPNSQKEQSVVIECKSRGEQCMDKVPNSQKEQSVVIECKSRGEQCMDKVPNSQKEQSVVLECKSRGEQCMDKIPNSQKEQSVVIECKSRGEQCMDKVPNSQKEQSVVIECKSRGEQCMDKVPNSQKEQSVVIECKSRGEQCMDKVPNSQKEQSVVIECKSRGEQCMDKVPNSQKEQSVVLECKSRGEQCMDTQTEGGDSDSDSGGSTVSVEYPALSTAQYEEGIGLQQKTKKWSKYHCCCFCDKKIIKMARHFEMKHQNEPTVAQILLLPKGSNTRRRGWLKLINEGDYKHNFEVLEKGRVIVIPKYRGSNIDIDRFVPCPSCKGMYRKEKLAAHCLKCKEGQKVKASKEGKLLLPVPPNISKSLWQNVLLKMIDDDVAKNAKKDSLIVEFGERIHNRRDVEEHTADHVSCRMRELSRLVLDMKKESSNAICSLTEALQVKNFDSLIKSVRNVAEYADDTHTFKKGSLARKLGYSVQTCATILKSKAIQNSDKDAIENASNFLSLFSGNWYDHISSMAGQSLEKQRFNKSRCLPCCKDVQKLYSYVKNIESDDYGYLAKAALCEISLFNRKRGGEIQRMTIETYENGLKNQEPPDAEIMESLTPTEKIFLNSLARVEIRGKFNRRVPILLSKTMLNKIEKLLGQRQKLANVNSKYLFATPTGERPYRGSDAIRLMAIDAGVSNPQVFTWTALRKQIATMSQAMEISETEQDQLAQFLGHDIRIHRSFYRLPLDVVEKTNVAKILMRINAGKEVLPEDLSVDDDLELNPDVNASDMSDEEEEDSLREGSIRLERTTENIVNDNASTLIIQKKPQKKSLPKKGNKSSKKTVKRKWTEIEKCAVLKHLRVYIEMKKVPGKAVIEKAIEKESCLNGRSWRNIKDFCYNEIKKR